MLPYPYNPQSVVVTSQNGIWIVTAQSSSYTFTTEADANAFASIARESITAASEWYSDVRSLFRQLETLLAEAGRLELVYNSNDLFNLTMATPANTNVPGMNVPALRSLVVGSLMQNLSSWLDETVVVTGITSGLTSRRAAIGKRD